MAEFYPDRFEPNNKRFQRVGPANAGGWNPFSFGGGGSGLTAEQQNKIAKIMSFDYMGAAEYECRKLANCLAAMFEVQEKLEITECGKFFFLTHKEYTADAHELWHKATRNKNYPIDSLHLEHTDRVDGWFDFENCFFVGRTRERCETLLSFLIK